MRNLFFMLFSLFVCIGFWTSACGGNTGTTPANESQPGPDAIGYSMETLPEQFDSAEVAFRDLNFWTENDLFCIATVVDNTSNSWHRIWVRIELLDSAGRVLEIDGEQGKVVRALSDAIPPRGASAFFAAIPLGQVSGGIPVSCRLSGAGAVQQSPGAILISGVSNGVRMLKPDPQDSTKAVEIAFQASTTIENPLPVMAEHLRIVLLLYGKDDKLWFVQLLNPEDPKQVVKLERQGPMEPGEKRNMSCPISYAMLPKKLQEVLIGRVDVQAFDARE